jgi:hypothetical protein
MLHGKIRFAAGCDCPFRVSVESLPAMSKQRNFKSGRKKIMDTFRAVVFSGKPEKRRTAEVQMKGGEHLVFEWNAA